MSSWAGGLLSVVGGAAAGGAEEKLKLLDSEKKAKLEQAKLDAIEKRENAYRAFLSGENVKDRTHREGILAKEQEFTTGITDKKIEAERENIINAEKLVSKRPIETEKLYDFLKTLYGEEEAKALIKSSQTSKTKPSLEREKLYNEVYTDTLKALSGDLPPTSEVEEKASTLAGQISGFSPSGEKTGLSALQELQEKLKLLSNSKEKIDKGILTTDKDVDGPHLYPVLHPYDTGEESIKEEEPNITIKDEEPDITEDGQPNIDPITGSPLSKGGSILGTPPTKLLNKFRETKEQQRPYMAVIDGEEVEIPLITPNQSLMDKKHLRDGKEPTQEMIDKAIKYAKENKKKGRPYFRQTPK
ncbi:MAG: hypothetical protein H8D87_04850 [Deltaproteobacteria bacterium]|nr:hypothetical protein [Candidatus Desulfobacula maris]